MNTSTALSTEHERIVRTATNALSRDFSGTFAAETIERLVADSLEQLAATARITTYLPLLTEKLSRERLSARSRVTAGRPWAVPGQTLRGLEPR